jgi:hypothetical protein
MPYWWTTKASVSSAPRPAEGDRLSDRQTARCRIRPNIREPALQHRRGADPERQLGELLAHSRQHHLLLLADAATEQLPVSGDDAGIVLRQGGAMGMQQCDAIHPGVLMQDEFDEARQAVGVGDDPRLQRGFEPVGEGKGADRQRRIRELQQAREMSHAAWRREGPRLTVPHHATEP